MIFCLGAPLHLKHILQLLKEGQKEITIGKVNVQLW
jgi:hypothetical protein